MKKCIICLTLVLSMLALSISASAHPVPDLTRRGSITVTMRYDGKPVPGSLNVYQAGYVHEDDGNYSFVPVSALQDRIPEFVDIQSPTLADTLANYAQQKILPPATAEPVPIGEDGTAVFSDLALGLYLVVQSVPAPGHENIRPFLVSVPYLENGCYIYDVNPITKTELEPEIKPTAPPSDPGNNLPQTGQLWWPVPILIGVGLGSIVVGLLRRREAEDET